MAAPYLVGEKMAWNKDQPQNSTKLRLSAAIIRANWAAIETGGVPYDYLKLSEQLADPTRVDDYGWLFTKEEDSQTELFYMDDRNPAVVTQITKNGKIGLPTQGIWASTIQMDDTTPAFTFGINQMIIAMGHVTSAGTLTHGINIDSAARTAAGRYTVTITADALITSNYLVMVTTNRVGAGNVRNPIVIGKPAPVAATATAILIETVSSSDNDTDSSFDIIIIGGR